ncbi:glycosyltransferase family 4 protein [Myxococcota bacterium]|nr:glycosyltransferase family 4 protein [Myxococcota bacterium]
MRVAVVSTPFAAVPPRGYGGTELMVHALVEALARLGHAVVLYATWDSRTSAELRACYDSAQWPPAVMPEILHTSFALADVVADETPFDVVHVHCASALPMSRLARLPLVYTLHHHRTEELSRVYRAFPEVSYVAISRRQAELEVPLPHLDVIHHGLDPAAYSLGTGDGGYVAFLGRFAPCKGLHFAIDAARAAGIELRVAGEVHHVDQEYFDLELAARMALPGVRYLGPADHAAKVALLRGARALLFPIDWEEPFGLVLIEAMLCGCPVVAFPRGSVPEVVEHGLTGILAEDERDLPQAIGEALRLDRARIRERAVERWSAGRMAEEHLRVYRAAAARFRAGSEGTGTRPAAEGRGRRADALHRERPGSERGSP